MSRLSDAVAQAREVVVPRGKLGRRAQRGLLKDMVTMRSMAINLKRNRVSRDIAEQTLAGEHDMSKFLIPEGLEGDQAELRRAQMVEAAQKIVADTLSPDQVDLADAARQALK